MWYSNLEKTFNSRRILHQHWYTCPIALPVRRNPQYRSFYDCCLSHFRTWSGIICDFRTSLREFLDPVVNRFTGQTLPAVNRKYFFMNFICSESFCPQKKRSTKRCFSVVHPQAPSPFWLLKPASEQYARVLPDSHEAGLCCIYIYI
jgi:hypothetical protein